MKFIEHEDLCAIISHTCDTPSWNLSDFEKLLDKFGDDWYAEGGVWECVSKSKEMEKFKESFAGRSKA